MASADLRRELLGCSICLNIYTHPVTLRCGHNFCRECIDHVLDTQEGSGVYSCPECRAECVERPALVRNITLCNIVENVLSTNPDPDTGIFCTYCVDGSPVPAVKSCLMCEASLCDKHLRVHSKSHEHVLTDPTASMENKKCSIHRELLKYYCLQDAACICVSCRLDGDHRGHQVEMLVEASERRKEQLRNSLKTLNTVTEEIEKKIMTLHKAIMEIPLKAAFVKQKIILLVGNLRRHLDDLEKKALNNISRQEGQVSLMLSEMQQLEVKKVNLSKKISHLKELCNTSDLVTVLQESDETFDICDTEEIGKYDQQLPQGDLLDVTDLSQTLRTFLDIIKDLNRGIYTEGPAEILLDLNTAHNNLKISEDRKTATWTKIYQRRPNTPKRFQNIFNVLSSSSFSSGRHYWEVECSGKPSWKIGMCYPNIEREGDQSCIGSNCKSWCLQRKNDQLRVMHDTEDIQLPYNASGNRFRVFLNYEAGQLSFYELCEPIRHLHTFTSTFTQPLHAALCVNRRREGDLDSWLRILD